MLGNEGTGACSRPPFGHARRSVVRTRRNATTMDNSNNDNHITKTSVIIIPTIIATLDRHVFAAAKAQDGEKRKGKHVIDVSSAQRKERGSTRVLLPFRRAFRSDNFAPRHRRLSSNYNSVPRICLAASAFPRRVHLFIYTSDARFILPVRRSCHGSIFFLARGNSP